jgi:hypothetical protein
LVKQDSKNKQKREKERKRKDKMSKNVFNPFFCSFTAKQEASNIAAIIQ